MNLPFLQTTRQRWLYRYGLRRADQVVTQTASQREELRTSFGIESTLIPSCTADSGSRTPAHDRFPKSDQPTLVWVSRIVQLKRLEWLLDLAEMRPSYRFLVVGGGDESDAYVKHILARAHNIPNVQMLGRVSDRELWEVYERADLLLDTAAIAGVPTTFLEAWARGVPVVSTVNPDGIVTSNNLGRVVANVGEMAEVIRDLLCKPELWSDCSRAARQYFERHHTVQAVGAAYRRLFAHLQPGGNGNQAPV